jgi:peptidoglycan/LPS O-acetylase OafA/YrhL
MAASFALAIGVSWITYRCIEKPFLAIKGRIGRDLRKSRS